jgi:hypothetical protein
MSTETSEAGVLGALKYLGLSPFSSAMAFHFLCEPAHPTEATGDDSPTPGRPTRASMVRVSAWLCELNEVSVLAGGSTSSSAAYPASVLRPPSLWQRGCPEIIPGLTAKPFWFTGGSTLDLSPSLLFIHELCTNYSAIRSEVLSLAGKKAFTQYAAPNWKDQESAAQDNATPTTSKPVTGTDSGAWHVCYLDLHNVDCTAAQSLLPLTASIIKSIPRGYGHCLVSAMAAHTHITTHTGPTNRKLRLQFPLTVPTGSTCRLRAGNHTHVLEEGKPFVFDDSFQHEAWNDSDEPRIVLIVDIWHPDLTHDEVRHTAVLRTSILYYIYMCV